MNDNTETITENMVKTGHNFLEEMCAFNADFNAFRPRVNPITNRVEYICFQLKKMGVPFDVDMFIARKVEENGTNSEKYVNIYSFFKGQNTNNETIVFLAHHDVARLESENCQDNTASVCNLLHLCGILKDKKLNKNVLVVWTDAEEIVSWTNSGAKRLSVLCNLGFFGKVTKAINLELTANGTELWASCDASAKLIYEIQTEYKARRVGTPYNDSIIIEDNKIESVCIGILTPSELDIALQRGFCATWGLCHKMEDTFDKANAEDMKRFVENVLLKMAEA